MSAIDEDNVKVVVRIRPLQANERKSGDIPCVKAGPEGKEVQVKVGPLDAQVYRCNHCFPNDTSQSAFFNDSGITDLLDFTIKGYRSCAFAFGQTGAGKTFTMIGPSKVFSHRDKQIGMVGRSLEYLFSKLDSMNVKYSIKVSCIEIYHEQVFDLFADERERVSLPVREHSTDGFFLEGCKMVACRDYEIACTALDVAMKNRQTGGHDLNSRSSRSHCLTEIYVDIIDTTGESAKTNPYASQYDNEGDIKYVSRGKMSLIDLAGSERLKATNSTGKVLQEAGFINRSLYVLGKVIAGLVRTNGDLNHKDVPFRDSKLTKLLISSLGGSCHTLLVSCVSEAKGSQAETLRTLKFSMSCARIRNKPMKFLAPQERLILELREEIKRLRSENKQLRSNLVTAPAGGSGEKHNNHHDHHHYDELSPISAAVRANSAATGEDHYYLVKPQADKKFVKKLKAAKQMKSSQSDYLSDYQRLVNKHGLSPKHHKNNNNHHSHVHLSPIKKRPSLNNNDHDIDNDSNTSLSILELEQREKEWNGSMSIADDSTITSEKKRKAQAQLDDLLRRRAVGPMIFKQKGSIMTLSEYNSQKKAIADAHRIEQLEQRILRMEQKESLRNVEMLPREPSPYRKTRNNNNNNNEDDSNAAGEESNDDMTLDKYMSTDLKPLDGTHSKLFAHHNNVGGGDHHSENMSLASKQTKKIKKKKKSTDQSQSSQQQQPSMPPVISNNKKGGPSPYIAHLVNKPDKSKAQSKDKAPNKELEALEKLPTGLLLQHNHDVQGSGNNILSVIPQTQQAEDGDNNTATNNNNSNNTVTKETSVVRPRTKKGKKIITSNGIARIDSNDDSGNDNNNNNISSKNKKKNQIKEEYPNVEQRRQELRESIMAELDELGLGSVSSNSKIANIERKPVQNEKPYSLAFKPEPAKQQQQAVKKTTTTNAAKDSSATNSKESTATRGTVTGVDSGNVSSDEKILPTIDTKKQPAVTNNKSKNTNGIASNSGSNDKKTPTKDQRLPVVDNKKPQAKNESKFSKIKDLPVANTKSPIVEDVKNVKSKLSALEKSLTAQRIEMEDNPGEVTAEVEEKFVALQAEANDMRKEIEITSKLLGATTASEYDNDDFEDDEDNNGAKINEKVAAKAAANSSSNNNDDNAYPEDDDFKVDLLINIGTSAKNLGANSGSEPPTPAAVKNAEISLLEANLNSVNINDLNNNSSNNNNKNNSNNFSPNKNNESPTTKSSGGNNNNNNKTVNKPTTAGSTSGYDYDDFEADFDNEEQPATPAPIPPKPVIENSSTSTKITVATASTKNNSSKMSIETSLPPDNKNSSVKSPPTNSNTSSKNNNSSSNNNNNKSVKITASVVSPKSNVSSKQSSQTSPAIDSKSATMNVQKNNIVKNVNLEESYGDYNNDNEFEQDEEQSAAATASNTKANATLQQQASSKVTLSRKISAQDDYDYFENSSKETKLNNDNVEANSTTLIQKQESPTSVMDNNSGRNLNDNNVVSTTTVSKKQESPVKGTETKGGGEEDDENLYDMEFDD